MPDRTAWFRNAAKRVLRDFDVPLELVVDARTVLVVDVDGTAAGEFDYELHRPDENFLFFFADWIGEQVVPESTAAWGEARPPCPGHTHPAAPELLDDEAWWICPRDQRRLGRVGELGR